MKEFGLEPSRRNPLGGDQTRLQVYPATPRKCRFGFTIALPDAAYEQHYVAGFRPREIPLDSHTDFVSATAFRLFLALRETPFSLRRARLRLFVLRRASRYHPLRLAEEIAIVDQMLGGRMELGLVSRH